VSLDPVIDRRRLLSWAGALALASVNVSACSSAQTQAPATEAPRAQRGTQPLRAVVQAPPPDGVLGANFNSEPSSISEAELRELSATWLRGFVPMPSVDPSRPDNHPVVARLRDASRHGYGTVLSLKFPYDTRQLPAPGDPAMEAELRRLDALLPIVLDSVSILVIGNEPFIETRKVDQGTRLNEFYEALARRVIQCRHQRNARTQLYMGAMNKLDQPDFRTPATDRWLSFAHNTPEIQGVDIHPHLADPGTDRAYLDYVLPRLRADQKFLATEFSLVRFWKKHLRDQVSADFARQYGLPPGTLVWQAVQRAIAEPFPQPEWTQFLDHSPWFDNNRDYLHTQVERFRKTGRLAAATYGIAQGPSMVKDFGPDSTPWLLNSLFCPFTVRHRGELPGGNQEWIRQFRALQQP
jgi:hypothetical protein